MKNSEIEQYYFEMFRRDYPLPEGAVEYGDKPDVIVRGARTIGIEIRNFFLEDGSLPDGEQIVSTVVATAAAVLAAYLQFRYYVVPFSTNVPKLQCYGSASPSALRRISYHVECRDPLN